MYSIVALMCCIGVAAASLCCIPPQWEGQGSFLTTVVYNGKPHVSRGSVAMAYDAVRRRIGQYERISIDGRTEMALAALLDFNTDTKYVLHGDTCYKEALGRTEQDFSGCVPDNATVIGNRDVVGFGDNDMVVNTYALQFPDLTIYATLTADGCVPVVQTIRGTIDGNSFLQNNHFFNISAGLSQPENLNVPPVGCENAINFQSSFSRIGANSILGRRSFLGI